MTRVGCFLSSEEFSPKELVEQAKMAEDAGFHALWISDRYNPWNDRHGHSGFVWGTIGALSEAVDPQRAHPGRPSARLDRCAARDARGGRRDHPPAVDRRARQPPWQALHSGGSAYLHAAGRTAGDLRFRFGKHSAALAGRLGDGYISVLPEPGLVEAFRQGGGAGKPTQGGFKVCFGRDKATAGKHAHRLWSNELLPGELPQVFPQPGHFEQAASLVTQDAVADHFVCGNDPDEHLRELAGYLDAGYDEVFVNQIGPEQQGFFEFYGREILPQLDNVPG
jgi:alkanesulfonate monooxygenase SsuD/methylene tetrahydromethanopterin reductase-like flavin-dependent oxidoreductase (luciferase family)